MTSGLQTSQGRCSPGSRTVALAWASQAQPKKISNITCEKQVIQAWLGGDRDILIRSIRYGFFAPNCSAGFTSSAALSKASTDAESSS